MKGLVRALAPGLAATALACGADDRGTDRGVVVSQPAVLAEAPLAFGGLTLQVLDVVRVGEAVLEVRLAVINPASGVGPVAINTQFASDPEDAGSLADVFLIDARNQRRYLVIRDGKHRPACSTHIAPIQPGEIRRLWVQVLTPPVDVTRIGVVVPGGPELSNLPITPEPASRPPRL